MKFGQVETYHIPYTMRESGTSLTSKALFITSDDDIAVYAVNRELYSADAFLALPIDVLGKQYYAGDSQISYFTVLAIMDLQYIRAASFTLVVCFNSDGPTTNLS